MAHHFAAAEHGVVQIGIERFPIGLRHEAHEPRIAEPASRIASQSETDGGTMAEVEQKSQHMADIGI